MEDGTFEKLLMLAFSASQPNLLLVFWLNNVFLCTRLLESDKNKFFLVFVCVSSGAFTIQTFFVEVGIVESTTFFIMFTAQVGVMMINLILMIFIGVQHSDLHMSYHIAQKKENDQYKRMIDSIDEAFVVVQDG